MARIDWKRTLRGLMTAAAVTGMVWTCLACSDDDDDGGNSKCKTGCAKAAELCGMSSSDEADCVSQCNQYTDEQIDAAAACMEEATTCTDADNCIP